MHICNSWTPATPTSIAESWVSAVVIFTHRKIPLHGKAQLIWLEFILREQPPNWAHIPVRACPSNSAELGNTAGRINHLSRIPLFHCELQTALFTKEKRSLVSVKMEREQYSIHAKPHILLMNYTNEFLKDISTLLGAWVHQKTNTPFPYLQAGGAPGQLWEVQLCNRAPSKRSERAVRNIFPCCSQGAQRLRQFMRQTALCNPPHKHKGVGDFKWCFLLPLKSFTHGLKTWDWDGFPASISKQTSISHLRCELLPAAGAEDKWCIQDPREKGKIMSVIASPVF